MIKDILGEWNEFGYQIEYDWIFSSFFFSLLAKVAEYVQSFSQFLFDSAYAQDLCYAMDTHERVGC